MVKKLNLNKNGIKSFCKININTSIYISFIKKYMSFINILNKIKI